MLINDYHVAFQFIDLYAVLQYISSTLFIMMSFWQMMMMMFVYLKANKRSIYLSIYNWPCCAGCLSCFFFKSDPVWHLLTPRRRPILNWRGPRAVRKLWDPILGPPLWLCPEGVPASSAPASASGWPAGLEAAAAPLPPPLPRFNGASPSCCWLPGGAGGGGKGGERNKLGLFIGREVVCAVSTAVAAPEAQSWALLVFLNLFNNENGFFGFF